MSVERVIALCGSAAAFFTVLVLVRAAWHKLRDMEQFAQSIREYELLPSAAAGIAAWLMVTCESAVALLLTFSLWPPLGSWMAMALFVFYGMVIAVSISNGRTHIDCGCGRSVPGLNWFLVTRNFILTGVAAVPLLSSFSEISRADRAITATMSIVLFLIYLLADEIVGNISRMSRFMPTGLGAIHGRDA